MLKTEAAAILEQLINGVDPETGELLADDHVCTKTTVMRALHMGYVALMQTEKVHFPEAYKKAFLDKDKLPHSQYGRNTSSED